MKIFNLAAAAMVFFVNATFATSVVASNSACSTEQVEGNKYNVIDDDGHVLGYVDEEPNGSWFMWIEGQGAQNDTAFSFERAVERVCNLGNVSP